MKSSASKKHSEMQDFDVSEAPTDSMDIATAGKAATLVKTDTDHVIVSKKSKQRFPGNMLLKKRHHLTNDAESATDSSEHFTENELHTSTDHIELPGVKKHRHKIPSKKRDLINLQSNLSPKYIGYANANSPIAIKDSNSDDNKTRSTRRRNHTPVLNSSFELNGKDRERDSDVVSAAVTAVVVSPKPSLPTTPHMLPINGPYMSPIDKLLIKNGANSPNSTGFEADAEDVLISRPSRKLQKRKVKRGPRTKTKTTVIKTEITAEDETSKHIAEKDEILSVEMGPTLVDGKPDLVIKIELAEVDTNGSETLQTTEQIHLEETKVYQTEVNKPQKDSEQKKDSEGSNVEILFALPTATLTEIEAVKSPPDLKEAPINSDHSIKSPSSISIDSAKGSSISTESGWPTYQTGDLYWGKLFNYCFWPCMVCPDESGLIVGNPTGQQLRKSTDSVPGGLGPVQVHVRFFADNGRHNWIRSENLLPFAGLKAFEELREDVRIKHGAKSVKYRQMVAKQKQLLVWRQAIEEAQLVGNMSYDLRLDKFFKIHSKNVELNKKKRKLSRLQDTSDVGSSLYDSNDNLHAKPPAPLEIAVKRERSSSPFSPAFSPVKRDHEKRKKRRKLSGSVEAPVGSNFEPETLDEKPMTDLTKYDNPEFGQLLDAIKEYVLVYREDEQVEKVLLAVVKNIWSLRQLQLRELERDLTNGDAKLLGSARLGTERGRGAGTIKRLSNRLKTMVLRRSITPVVPASNAPALQQQNLESIDTDQQVSELPKVKKPVGRPIDEVIEDIMQLDRKYLFRGLNREPVCKYCYQPGGDIARCSLACNSWLHAACLEIKKAGKKATGTKSSRGRKTSGSTVKVDPQPISPISESETATIPAAPHITGDNLLPETDETETMRPLICQECAIGKSEPCCICHGEKPEVNSITVSQIKEAAVETAESTEDQEAQSDLKCDLVACSHPMCTNKFHISCCKYWQQASINTSLFRCPMHVCHTCVADDPSGKYQQLGSAKLVRCVKCPATYHQDSRCIPAGSRILTTTHLICPRHNTSKADANLNVLWCYICVRGGELVCCETCPIAVHAHCRNIPIKTNESYICEECESGRLPLYGEIVWAKFNSFRWWPAIILPPTEIPNNILKKSHGPSDFVVRFFGTNDHGWISRRRVYLYIEGDTGDGNKSKSIMSQHYTAGVEEATHYLKILKEKRHEQSIVKTNGKLHPPPYVKIKANKPMPPVRFVYNEEDLNVCECKAGSEHPCGPESGCLNRMLFHECNPDYCHAGSKCENQMFELRKSPRLEVVYMNERGFGLVSREPIVEGTFIIEYVGEVINHLEFQRRMAQKTSDRDENFYFLEVEKDFIIDAGPKGNLARFMNHSCEPNCASQKWTVNGINRVGLFAIKDIPENTELTFNYLWDDLMNNGKKACFCGAKRCSGTIGGKLKDDGNKETGPQAGKSKVNSKVKHKGMKINIGTTKKKLIKKSKSASNSIDNTPTQAISESIEKL